MIRADQAARQRAATPTGAAGGLLVAVRGDDADDILPAARLLEARTGWAINILTVLEPAIPYLGLPAPVPPLGIVLPPETEAPSVEERRASIRQHLDAIGERAPRWPVQVLVGRPAESIADAARRGAADILVMGLHDHGALDRFFGAETTLEAFSRAARPVLGVRGRWTTLPRTVVVGMDFKAASIWAARQAVRCIAPDATVVLAHVWEPPEMSFVARRDPVAYRARLEDEILERLTEVEREIGFEPSMHVEHALIEGRPADALLELAETRHADLVVVGTHGRGFFARLLVGGVAAAVARGAKSSVLLAPPPASHEARDIERHLGGFSTSGERGDWHVQLEQFAARNMGRRAVLEVDDPELGAQTQQSGYQLMGADYDEAQDTVILMLGVPGKRAHLTRMIPNAGEISIQTFGREQDEALRIAHGMGQTILTFLPD